MVLFSLLFLVYKQSNLDPDEVAKRCRFRGKSGKMQTPRWKNNSSGNYHPSCNVAPQAHTYVLEIVLIKTNQLVKTIIHCFSIQEMTAALNHLYPSCPLGVEGV